MEKLTYSIPEFQQLTGISSRTGVYQEINAGRLQTVKCGRRRLIPREAAEEWLARLQREAEEAQG
jgi:excisionase family DNA binding protein